MGLDLVEVVMQTEEVFGITIPDAEAAKAPTVGDLYRLVRAKLDIPYQPAQLDTPFRNPRGPAPTTAPRSGPPSARSSSTNSRSTRKSSAKTPTSRPT